MVPLLLMSWALRRRNLLVAMQNLDSSPIQTTAWVGQPASPQIVSAVVHTENLDLAGLDDLRRGSTARVPSGSDCTVQDTAAVDWSFAMRNDSRDLRKAILVVVADCNAQQPSRPAWARQRGPRRSVRRRTS